MFLMFFYSSVTEEFTYKSRWLQSLSTWYNEIWHDSMSAYSVEVVLYKFLQIFILVFLASPFVIRSFMRSSMIRINRLIIAHSRSVSSITGNASFCRKNEEKYFTKTNRNNWQFKSWFQTTLLRLWKEIIFDVRILVLLYSTLPLVKRGLRVSLIKGSLYHRINQSVSTDEECRRWFRNDMICICFLADFGTAQYMTRQSYESSPAPYSSIMYPL